MPAGATTQHTSVRFLAPDLIVRGQSNTLRCPLSANGNQVVPSSGTVSIFSPDGTAVVDEAAVTVSGDASYTFTPSTSLTLGMKWRVEWTLLVSGETKKYRNDAALVRYDVYPVLTDDDLYRRVRALNPSSAGALSTLTTYQDFRDEAFAAIQLRLIDAGNRPNLIMSPSSLREVHLLLTLAMIFEDFATSLNAAFESRALSYRDLYEAAWGRLTFSYDSSDSGKADARGRRSATPTVWLSSRR